MYAGIVKYQRFMGELRTFLKSPVNLEKSIQVITQRLRDRNKNFMALIQTGVYDNPCSPYLMLLRHAGCEYGDIEASVNKNGIESTLQKLERDGVYLSWEEFKGKKEVVRGGSRFQFRERDFDNPYLPDYYQVRSSGSRSAGTRTTFDLNYTLEKSYYRSALTHAFKVQNYPLGLYFPILPSAAGLGSVLQFMKSGTPIDKWFSPVNEKQVQASFRDRLALRYFIHAPSFWGLKIPYPQYVNPENTVRIAGWIADMKRKHGGCNFSCFVSLAVMICQAAIKHGLDIAGSHFVLGGEPLTQGKREQIAAAGVTMTSTYFITEIGWIGCSCPNYESPDDTHLFNDAIAAIQRSRSIGCTGQQVDSLAYTTLLPSSPKILINLESDDYGVYENKKCGCFFEELGFTHHISHIRSFAKLTGQGMTIVGSDFVYILENVLPREFGGVATDYQLVEEEDEQSHTRLILNISPSVGELDNRKVIGTILRELKRGIYGGKLASGVWLQAEALQIRRANPISNSGKVLTLHLVKNKQVKDIHEKKT